MHKFIYENDYTEQEPRKITFEVGMDADLTEMIEAFENYLKAVGYNWDGVLDIQPEQSSDYLPYGYPAYNYNDMKVTYK